MTGEPPGAIRAQNNTKTICHIHTTERLAKKVGDFININPLIEAAFTDFAVGTKHIPISFLNYEGDSNVYLTYYTWHDESDNFYDDEHHAEIAYGTIDIFSKGNFKGILKGVKNKLKQNGFTWTDNGPESFERDTGYYHVPVNFYYADNVENN